MIKFVENAQARKVPPGMQIKIRRLLSSVLLKAGLPLDAGWEVRFRRQKKGTPHTPEFGVRKLTDRRTVELEVKPAGNDTAHVVELVVPPELAVKVVQDSLAALSDSSVSAEQKILRKIHDLRSSLEDLVKLEERLWERLSRAEKRRAEIEEEIQGLESDRELLDD